MIRKSLKNLIRWANTHYERDDVLIDNTTSVRIGGLSNDASMNFSLHPASGGYVLEYRHYDRKTDRNDNKLHIINHGEDLGEKIGEIITLELMRN